MCIDVSIAILNILKQDKGEQGCMGAVVGALDGLVVELAAPATTECVERLLYYSRAMEGYGINMKDKATARCCSSGVTIRPPGATNDLRLHPSFPSCGDCRTAQRILYR